MTRIVKFAKIDFLRIKKYWWIILFPLLSIAVYLAEPERAPLFVLSYCLFAAIIFTTIPLSVETPSEIGFLRMLPSRPGERQKGHFLFSFLFDTVAFGVGFISMLVCRLVNPTVEIFTFNGINLHWVYLMLFGLSLIIIGIQNMGFCIFHAKNAQVMAIFRMVPGFIFLFGTSALYDSDSSFLQDAVVNIFRMNGIVFLIICILIFLALGQITAVVSERKSR